jgi:hypothetical protein
MGRDFEPVGVNLTAGLGKCSGHCRYCQLAYKKPAKFSVSRYAAVVDKFLDYKAKTGFGVSQWLGYSFDFSADDFGLLLELHRRVSDCELKVLLLGGLPLMTGKQLDDWFSQRRNLGSDSVVASFYGAEAGHDYLNNKKGHFEWQISAQNAAARLGFKNYHRIFLIKSALPHMNEILDRLEEVDNVDGRVAYLLFYSGLGRKFEDQRLTMEILDSQPERLKAIYRDDKPKWRSERAWLEWERVNPEVSAEGHLNLILTDRNIDLMEKLSCEEIISDLTLRTKAAYQAVPGRAELAEKYGDPSNDKLYMFMWDMECLWVDRFLKASPNIVIDRNLTHFGR